MTLVLSLLSNIRLLRLFAHFLKPNKNKAFLAAMLKLSILLFASRVFAAQKEAIEQEEEKIFSFSPVVLGPKQEDLFFDNDQYAYNVEDNYSSSYLESNGNDNETDDEYSDDESPEELYMNKTLTVDTNLGRNGPPITMLESDFFADSPSDNEDDYSSYPQKKTQIRARSQSATF